MQKNVCICVTALLKNIYLFSFEKCINVLFIEYL